MRLYFYAKHNNHDTIIFLELRINRSNAEMNILVKSENNGLGAGFGSFIEDCFRGWQLIQ